MSRQLSDYWVKKIILHFCIDIEASKTAKLTGLNRNTINAYYSLFRQLIAKKQEGKKLENFNEDLFYLSNSIYKQLQLPASNKIARKTLIKYPVYRLIEREGQVFSEEIPPATIHNILYAEVQDQANEIHAVHGFELFYDALLFDMFPRLFFPDYDQHIGNKKGIKIFIIESFWSFSTRRLQKFNGISRQFYYHLKECEWRWRKTDMDLEVELLAMYRSGI
jgi:transposase-like protein